MIPRLHLVSNDDVLADAGFARMARDLLVAGGASIALHIRGPGTSGARHFELARSLQPVALSHGALLVVNDRVDVALTLGLAVHLGARSLPPAIARSVLGGAAALGVSVRTARAALDAAPARPEFLIAGTVYRSASHPGRPGSGTDLIPAVVDAGVGPVLGIGGIEPHLVAEVLRAGAHGVAVLSGVWKSPAPLAAVRAYLDALEASPPGTAARSVTTPSTGTAR